MSEPFLATVLVVDDEPDLCEIVSFEMENAGFKTIVATSGVEAQRILSEQNIDLVVSDVRMPKGDGIQLLKEIKKENPTLPTVVFMTGFMDAATEDAYDWGAEAVFSKPVNYDALVDVVKNCVQRNTQGWAERPHREPVQLTVEVSFEGAATRQLQTANIARGGMFIAMDSDFPKKGDSLEFKLIFNEEDKPPIRGHGVVRWVREHSTMLPSGCGVEFTPLKEASRAQILELVNALITRAYIPKK